MKRFTPLQYILELFLLTTVYFIAGKLGLRLAYIHPSASSVWAPTGIALTALLCLGYRVWPGIALGAFLVNFTTAGSFLSTLGISVGNTLEAFLGAWLVNCFCNGRYTFEKPQNALKFVVLAGFTATLLSPTIGVTSLALTGFASWTAYGAIWLTWWLGDVAGALIVAPLLILWSQPGHVRWTRSKILEVTFLALALFYLSLVVFSTFLFPQAGQYALEFLCIPPIIWTAYRFGERETATATFLLSIIAIWGTVHGHGPFAHADPTHTLLLLQTFMGVISVMGLILSSLVSERDKGEEALQKSNEILELHVEERTLSLSRLVADLRIEIIQRKEIEKHLRESQERFRLLVENVKDYAIFMLDAEGNVVSWNAGAERIKGYTSEEIMGRHFSVFYTRDDIARGKPDQELQTAVAQGVSQEVGVRLRKDGSAFWADTVITALFDKGGQLRGFAKVTRDITESRIAEKKIQLYSDIVNNTQIGVVVLQMDVLGDAKTLRMIAANPSASEVTGMPMETVVGTTLLESFPNLYKTTLPEQFADIARTNTAANLGEIQYEDPRVKAGIFSVKAFPLPDRCIGVTFENITARRQTEEALSESEERFRQLVDSNIIGFMLADAQGRIQDANAAMLKLLGYDRSFLSDPGLDEASISPPQYASLDQWMRDRLAVSGMCPPIEKEFIRKDGCRIPVLVGMVQLRGAENNRLSFVIDATERRSAQDAMRKAYDELELRVQQRTAELQEEVVRRQRAEEELRNQAIRDPLTGLYNRRGFIMLAEKHLELARRQKKPLLIFMGDLDGLKPINDTFGHAEGDAALTQTAELLRKTFRQADIIARIGGDEYAVACVEEADTTGSDLLERLHRNTDEHNRYSGRPYVLRLSIGTARIEPETTETLEHLMQQADSVLYEQKKQKTSSPLKIPHP